MKVLKAFDCLDLNFSQFHKGHTLMNDRVVNKNNIVTQHCTPIRRIPEYTLRNPQTAFESDKESEDRP